MPSSPRSFIFSVGILIGLVYFTSVASMQLSRASFTQRTMSAAFTSLSSSSSTPPQEKASLKSYYQLVVDREGETSVLKRDFKDVQEVGYSNTPQLLTKVPASFATPTNVIFTALQGENPWHHCPTPQLVVCLRGGWYVKTTDGIRVDLLPGDVIYQDNTADHPAARTGTHAAMHFSGSLDNDEPCDQMIVQLELKDGGGTPMANSKEAGPPF
jgi:hypothetical protein